MSKMMSKLKQKTNRINHMEKPGREVHYRTEGERRFLSARIKCNQNSVMEMPR